MKIYNTLATLALGTLMLTGCLPYDNPGDELNSDTQEGDNETYQGNVDSIDYESNITQNGLYQAESDLEKYLGSSLSAQYALRGGKDNGMPEAHAYQYQYSLGIDAYAGYLVVSHKDFPYSNATLTSTYNIADQFNSGPRGNYTLVKNALMPMLHHPAIDSIPEWKAINLLYYCIAAQELADISGPFTYLEDKQNSENPATYNDMKTIYEGIYANIRTIVATLKHFDQRPDWYQEEVINLLQQYCQTSRCAITGDYSHIVESFWRLANSLQLRMAMHIVKVEPEMAKAWAQEAVASGVIESEEMTHGLYPKVSGFTNPLVEIAGSWSDTRLCASFESILMSLDHPYTHMLWNKNSNIITNQRTGEQTPANSRIVGIRAGAFVGEGQSYAGNEYIAYSTFNPTMMSNAPLYLLKWSEVDFLRAEGAVRGWAMGGEAKFFYDRGILNASLDEPDDRQWYKEDGIDGYDNYIVNYMNRESAIDYVQTDPRGDGSNESWSSLTKIGVKWNDADDQETKLEKIITQKYIALFPLSTEAWTELRRTGYPRIFPVLHPEEGDGTLSYGDLIRRVPWIPTDPQAQQNVDDTGVPALGGEDFQATRLWWDLDVPNF